MSNSIKYSKLMDKGDNLWKRSFKPGQNRNKLRRKAKRFYRQADYVFEEASAPKVNKRKFTFNIKVVFKSFFGFLKKLCSLIIVLLKLIFQRKQNSKKSK